MASYKDGKKVFETQPPTNGLRARDARGKPLNEAARKREEAQTAEPVAAKKAKAAKE